MVAVASCGRWAASEGSLGEQDIHPLGNTSSPAMRLFSSLPTILLVLPKSTPGKRSGGGSHSWIPPSCGWLLPLPHPNGLTGSLHSWSASWLATHSHWSLALSEQAIMCPKHALWHVHGNFSQRYNFQPDYMTFGIVPSGWLTANEHSVPSFINWGSHNAIFSGHISEVKGNPGDYSN